jgi:hypothetical protein
MLWSLNIAAGPLFNRAIFDVSHPARSMNRSTNSDSNNACRLLERSSGVIVNLLKLVNNIAGRVT